jgi:SAM-dependent methyltransferase
MTRRLHPELLDQLPSDDPRARRSRRDLQRLNLCMGNVGAMARALRRAFDGRAPRRILELGAGDGTFLLRVARRLAPAWANLKLELLDRQRLLQADTQAAIARLGWQVEGMQADVFDWLRRPPGAPRDALLANLFLHHFSEAQLTELLSAASRCAPLFAALEPRRARLALACSRMVWLIGCGRVTRHDAPVSVRAGFAARELSALWPAGPGWSLHEGRAGLFGHLFVARRSA